MTAQEHANAIWRAEPSPEALAGAISAYTDELRGELHRLKTDHAAEVERLKEFKEGWKSATFKMTEQAKEIEALHRKVDAKMPTCGHCRGEIGVVLTTCADRAAGERALKTVDTLTAENAALKELLADANHKADYASKEVEKRNSDKRRLLGDLTAARARIAELEGVIKQVEQINNAATEGPAVMVGRKGMIKDICGRALSTQAPSK